MESKAEAKRRLIIESAIQFLFENDFSELTLDAVAKQAGISKGGLLYHFPNKEALIKGIAKSIFENVSHSLKEIANIDQNEKGKWSRAFIKSSKSDLENMSELNIGALAASLLNPDGAKTISEDYQLILNKLENDGINPVTATIIRLAIDGLYYSQMLNIAPIEEKRKEEVFQQLVHMTEKEK